MVSIIAPFVILVLTLFDGIQTDESISSEKIIIHVPYKIHNHLHTHTNYKIIKVPESNIENVHEQTQKPEETQYLNKQIDSILSGGKITHNLKEIDAQFKPQVFQNLNEQPPTIPVHTFHDLEVQKLETYHGIPNEAENEQITSPTRLPVISTTFHTTIPDYQYSEGRIVYHTFPTTSTFVPYYDAQIINPTYQVEEKQKSAERISLQITPDIATHSKSLSKSSKDAFIKSYIKKFPYSIRTNKYLPTAKAIKLPTTKLLSLPTTPSKTFVVPTTTSFEEPTTKVPKTLFKNNEEYEHIGYLVVGENSQKFVGINEKN